MMDWKKVMLKIMCYYSNGIIKFDDFDLENKYFNS